ncbi:MAG: Bax inhibitor-1/YccA family protein [Elusimicrobiaceae bacterium]|nr:Bax inhibitor-1/YccA family protein [Elusimicrobiaceae bacterium]
MAQGNPLFNERAYEQALQQQRVRVGEEMTLQGTINKTCFLLLLCVVGGFLGFNHAAAMAPFMWPIVIGAFVVAMIVIFKKTAAPLLAPVYALAEGLALGVISAAYQAQSAGIVGQAIAITLLVFGVMLFIYRTGIIKVNRTFITGVVAATGGIALFYLISLVLMLFGVNVAYFSSNSGWAIAINVFICIVAAMNFLIDFEFINQLTSQLSAPKYMEWYAGFSLMVTLVWLYLEILRLLGRSRSR